MTHSRCIALAACVAAAFAAQAHDTWFAPVPGGLSLTTGNRFPLGEIAVDDRYFARSACRSAGGADVPLRTQRFTDKATLLQPGSAADAPDASLTCFVQLVPFEFDVPLDKVEVYFKEIRPRPEIVAAWAALRARGLPFHERYTKSARIDLGPRAEVATPVGNAMDALRLAPEGALKVGDEARFQVLREGQPLPDFNVELVNERSPLGLWHRTDAQGRFTARLPLAGRWLLRGTDLRLAASNPDQFESWFLTLAFDVQR